MGCSSSVVVDDNTERTPTNNAIPTIKRNSLDKILDYSSLGNLKPVDDNQRRLSVLTVRSGNVKLHQCSGESPEMQCRAIESFSSTGTPLVAVRPFHNGRPTFDSPVPLRRNLPANGNLINSPLRVRSRNPLLSPQSQRFITTSLPTSPLVRVKEKPEHESDGRSSSFGTHSEKDFGSFEETQNRLNKALQELSRSLSDSHGSIFHLDSDEKTPQHSSPGSVYSTSPDVARHHRTSYDACKHDNKVVVMDIGSGYCKAGFSNDDVPSVVIPTLVGRPKSDDAFPGVARNTVFVGNDVKLRRDVLELSKPVKRGVVQNWEDWSSVVDHVLNMELKLDTDDLSAVLPESPLCNRQHREKKAEIMFEKFRMSKLYLGSSAPMALHAFGMTSGLLVSIGHDVTSCVPVIQGNVQSSGVRTLELGGSDVTKQLKSLIKSGHFKGVTSDKDESISKAIMERLCYVTNDAAGHTQAPESRKQRTYSLPSGASIHLDKERFTAPEILFDPSILGDHFSSSQGIHKMCFESVGACKDNNDDDVIKELYKNIVLTGGTSLLPGLSHRMKDEIFSLVDDSSVETVNVRSLPKRQYAVWRGASHMTSLQLSRGRWMTKAEFEEHGASIVHRKYV